MCRFFILAVLITAACGSHTDDSRARAAGSAVQPTPPSPPQPPPADSATAPNPCAYATANEVGAAVGMPIVVTEPVSADQCAYYPQPKPSNALYVRVSDGSPFAAMKQTMRNTEAVTGVGDDAFWAKPQLHVHAGAKMITIAVMDVRWKAGDSKAVAVEVAQKVVPRL